MKMPENDQKRNFIDDLLQIPFSDESIVPIIRLVVILELMISLPAIFYFLGWDWSYWAVITFAFVMTCYTATRYIMELYELTEFSSAFQYLVASVIGINLPTLTISKGKIDAHPDEINLIDRIGGPGWVDVKPGNVVLFERLKGLSNVYGIGKHFVHRYEFIKDAVSLDEQFCVIKNIEALTIDGIRVRIDEVKVRFMLWVRESDWSSVQPDHYSVEAVRNRAYNRLISETGVIQWGNMVQEIIQEAITQYINKRSIDQIISPEDLVKNARSALKIMLQGVDVRNKLKAIGARLVWFELGAFEFPDPPVNTYRLGKWKETKKGEIKVLHAEGDAFELSRQDAIRSKTQADMIQGIVNALEDLDLGDVEDLDTIIKIRTAQILDTWSGLYASKDKKSSGPDIDLGYERPEE
jgi:hypothetical protein